MASNLYTIARDCAFKSQGAEKKYLLHTTRYFQKSLRILIAVIILVAVVSKRSFVPILMLLPLGISRSDFIIRLACFGISILLAEAEFISLVLDWTSHFYTLRLPSTYCAFSLTRIIFLYAFQYEVTVDSLLNITLLSILMGYLQIDFRKIWADIELTKKKKIQAKIILNEIQTGILIFSPAGCVLSVNIKGKSFLNSRRIFSIDKLNYLDIFPLDSHKRLKNLFDLAVNGQTSEQEFILSHEQNFVPPLFTSIMLALRQCEFNSMPAVQMIITDIRNSAMRRRFVAGISKNFEETSVILKDTFIDLYFNRELVQAKHINSLHHYLLSREGLIILIDSLIGKCRLSKEYFELKTHIVNTVCMCWRSAKVKRLNISLICERALPKQAYGDCSKHDFLFKSVLEFAVFTAQMNSEIQINFSVLTYSRGASLEYKFIFYSKNLVESDLEYLFRTGSFKGTKRLFEENIEICEKYGLGLALFDLLLNALDGHVSQTTVFENSSRVILTYV